MDIGTKHILLVEDDAIIALTQVSLIRKFGYTVSNVLSGEKAVSRALEDPSIDLILMDIDLGEGMNGPEAARRILGQRTLPIVFLTSHSESSYVDMVRKITRYGYVIKNSGDFVLRSSIEMAFALFESNTQLREREEFYRHLFHTHPDPTFLIAQNGSVLDLNDAACASTGRNRDESRDLPVGDVDPNYPTDQFLAFWDPKLPGTNYTFESMHTKKDGTGYPVQIHGSKFSIHGKTYYYGVAKDISEVKAARRLVDHAKAILENLRELNQLILLDLEPKEFAQRAMGTICNNLGYTSAWIALMESDGSIKEGAQHGLGKDADAFLESMQKGFLPVCLRQVSLQNPAVTIENPKKSCADCKGIPSYQGQAAFCGLLAYQGVPYGYIVVSVPAEFAFQEEGIKLFTEIREDLAFGLFHARERTELRQSKVNLRNAERITRLGSWIFDSRNDSMRVSDEWRAIHGMGDETVTMDILRDMLHPEDRERVLNVFARSLEGGSRYEIEHRILRRDTGTLLHLRQYGEVSEWDSQGKARIISGMTLDVTDFVDTRNALSGTEDLYRSIVEHTSTAILCADDQGRYLSANQAAADLFGYPVEQLLTMGVSDLRTTTDPGAGERYRRYVEKGSESGEFDFIRPDGQARIAEYRAVRAGPNRHISLLIDVTDRKQAEAQIRALLAEKEMRLTEIRHRIKNNLNTVASLLTLQADSTDQPLTRLALTESTGRVRSISLLYDQLYNPGDGNTQSSSPYLENLCRSVVSLFPNAGDVELSLTVNAIEIDKQTLSSIGLVANEFITNAMKHAFHGPRPHRLGLEFVHGQDRLLLKVSDSGPGMPKDPNPERPPHCGLGNKIVSALAEQLGGAVYYVQDQGMTAILDLPWQSA